MQVIIKGYRYLGRSGITRKPNVLKQKEGTYNSTRDAGLELPASYPERPAILDNERAGEHWERIRSYIESTGVATQVDGIALALLANALADYSDYCQVIREEGPIAISEKGSPYQHPAVGMRNKCFDQIRRLLIEFGMTAAARSGLKLTNVADSDPLAVLLGTRMN